MALPDIFSPETTNELFRRIDLIRSETPALWGKMSASQMIKHCHVPYLQALGYDQKKPSLMARFLLKYVFKKSMINEVPYKPNLPTAPAFIVKGEPMLDTEREKLKQLIRETEQKGKAWFEGRKQLAMGPLKAVEWNNLLYKHIDHHLRQFGV
jgi:hypothetical protein